MCIMNHDSGFIIGIAHVFCKNSNRTHRKTSLKSHSSGFLQGLNFMNSGASKGTCRAEAMSSSEKIKPLSIAILELHWSEGIRHAGRQVSQSVENSVK